MDPKFGGVANCWSSTALALSTDRDRAWVVAAPGNVFGGLKDINFAYYVRAVRSGP
ncbi:MAG: hypothetical protein HY717_07515 [Planctomycetes bacterium]|nr:hypothetical protein [Planctomycetota bacterium]